MRKSKLIKYVVLAGAAYFLYTTITGGSLAGLGAYPPGFQSWPAWKRKQWLRANRGQQGYGYGYGGEPDTFTGGYGGGTNMPDSFTAFPGGYGGGYPFGGQYGGYSGGWGGPYYNPVYDEQAGSLASTAALLDASSEGN